MTWHDSTCPACGQRDRQILLGARNATLGAQVVAESWASPFNDDQKLIAFSDSVQDAAHRAGFFGARTYLNTVRTAIARGIDYCEFQPSSDGYFSRPAILPSRIVRPMSAREGGDACMSPMPE